MKHTIIFCLILVLFLSMAAFMNINASPQEKGNDKEKIDMEKAAEKAHELLKKISPKFREMLGFKSDEDLKQSSLGNPIEIYMMGLDWLEKFKQGDDPKKLLFDTKEVIYPVYVGETLITSITIRKHRGQWEHAAMGGHEIHIVEPARTKHSQASNMHHASYFMVQIPSMYLIFLGYYSQDRMYLVPSHQHPDLTFDLHEAVPAEDVILKLQPLVEKYKNVLTPPKK